MTTPKTAVSKSAVSKTGWRATILIVDDEQQNRRLLEALLGPEGYVTRTASGGKEALASIADDPPDLILLDVMMPEMDGRQVASAIKANPATSNIPIIIVTAQSGREARLAALEAGAEDFLTKPIDRAELWLRVRNLLRLKELSDLLENQRAILESEVQARTAELRSALVVKDTFVALVSHELRTPLTSIIGYLELAMDEVEGLPGPIGVHLIALARNADRLQVLVTDLLAVDQAERATMRLVLKSTDISSLARQSLEDLALRAKAAHVSISSDIEPGITINADSSRIRQVVDNLLSNALKYTPPTGGVALVLKRAADHVVLEVSDTGIGIHAEDLPGLFTKFFRARNAIDRAIPGIGLGLMITRTIVEAHDGTIEVHSQENVGTSMRVCLPLQPTAPDAPSRDGAHGLHSTRDVGDIAPMSTPGRDRR